MTIFQKLEALAQNPARTMTRGQFRQWYATERQNIAESPVSSSYQEKLNLRAQIEAEILPIKLARIKLLSINKPKSQRTPAAPVPSSQLPPPEIDSDFDCLSDKEGPKQKEALRKLNNLSRELCDKLDRARKKNFPQLA